LKTETEQIGAVETPDVGEVALSSGRSQIVCARERMFPEERLAVIKQDLNQASKEFSQFTDVIGNKP
jgi:hypothetical protein